MFSAYDFVLMIVPLLVAAVALGIVVAAAFRDKPWIKEEDRPATDTQR